MYISAAKTMYISAANTMYICSANIMFICTDNIKLFSMCVVPLPVLAGTQLFIANLQIWRVIGT